MRKIGHSLTFIILFFSFGGFVGGYLLSVIAGAAPFIIKDFSLSIEQISTIMGLILLGGIIAKLMLLLNDYFGRKKFIYVTNILLIAGILTFTFADSYTTLFWGRFIQGTGAIMSTVVFPIYLSEIAPTNKRGMMITTFQLSWTGGMLVANLVNLQYASTGNWQLMFNIILFIPVLLLVFTPFIVKSPRWLALKGRFEEAREIIKKINAKSSPEILDQELKSIVIVDTVDWSKQFKLIPKYFKPILFCTAIYVLTQLCGVNAIMQTSTIVLKDCGIQSNFMAIFGTILIAAMNFIMTIGTILLVDKLGRKKILKIGLCGFTISMIILAIVVGTMPAVALTGWLALICMLVAIGFLAFGPTGVVYVLLVEVLPTSVRTIGLIIGGFIALGIGTIFISKFLVIGESIGYPFLFGMMALFALIYLIFSITMLPETGGKSLEEIESEIK